MSPRSMKKLMNGVNKELNDNFESVPAYRCEINSTLASKIVDTMYKIFKNCKSNFASQALDTVILQQIA